MGELIRIARGLRKHLNSGKFRARIEEIISAKDWEEDWDEYLVVVWPEDRDPYVLIAEESELSPETGARVKGRGLSINLPLRACLSGLKT
jgi:hypothetical protein